MSDNPISDDEKITEEDFSIESQEAKKTSRLTTGRDSLAVNKKRDQQFTIDHERLDHLGLIYNQLYYTKLISGIVFGTVAGILMTAYMELAGTLWLAILLVGFIISVVVVRYGFRIAEEDLNQTGLLAKGTFTYVVVFISTLAVVWMILYTTGLAAVITVASQYNS